MLSRHDLQAFVHEETKLLPEPKIATVNHLILVNNTDVYMKHEMRKFYIVVSYIGLE
jgi:hypothetical protein